MTIVPPYLREGSKIGMICPAGYMPLDNMQKCLEKLCSWGFQVVMGKTPGHQHHYFSGTDEERLADLQTMLDDETIEAIMCARGGYGVSKIIDLVNWERFKKHPKWIIGFSDITVLHAHLLSNLSVASLHAPMAAAFNHTDAEDFYVNTLQQSLSGSRLTYYSEPHPYNIPGRCEGVLTGGNLSMLIHLTGTKSEVSFDHKILFLEDVGEYIYHIDRMFVQLTRAGKLSKLAGLVVGGFTDCKDTAIPFGRGVYEAIFEHTKALNIPVCYQFPVSHDRENVSLKHGLRYRLTVEQEAELTELCP